MNESRSFANTLLYALAATALCAPLVTGCATSAPAVEPARPAPPAAASTPARPADFKTLGREDAPVTVIEFTDMQCPYCGQFDRETFPQLRRNYIDTGKVRYASRDLPLSFHPYALPAAVAARCAGEQGKYWDYRAAVFRAQPRLQVAPYDELAAALKLDMQAFAACRRSGREDAAVRADAALAAQHGIASTPTFVVGHMVDGQFQGQSYPGALSYAAFQELIESLLR